VITGLYRRGKLGQLYIVSTCPEKVLAIGRFMTTLILEVGAGFEFYVSGVIIVITRQRPKPLLRPPMPLPTKLWREWNHSIFTCQILRILGNREKVLILRDCPGSPPGFLWGASCSYIYFFVFLCFLFLCLPLVSCETSGVNISELLIVNIAFGFL